MATLPTTTQTIAPALEADHAVLGTAESSLATAVTADAVRGPIDAAGSRPSLVERLLATRWFCAVLAFAVFLLLWYGIAAWLDAPIQFPGPVRVGSALVDLAAGGELFEHAAISTVRL